MAFMQRVTLHIGIALYLIEDELQDTFLPVLFQGTRSQIPGREITSIPVKRPVIALPNPTQTAGANWTTSYVIIGHFVAALRGTAEFRSEDNDLLVREGRAEIRRRYL